MRLYSIESRLDKIEKLLLNHSHSISTGGIEPYIEYEKVIDAKLKGMNKNLVPRKKITYKVKNPLMYEITNGDNKIIRQSNNITLNKITPPNSNITVLEDR